MTTPYSIEIFVPDGDPDGLWVVNQRNWTGVSLVFPRQNWSNTKKRSEFEQAGIYILTGYHEDDPDLPVLYIGQTDNLRKRIEQHVRTKDFWDKAVVFVATNNFLNRAHVTWLEWYLYDRASRLGRCQLENSQTPQIPTMSEAESADMHVFSDQMLRILPLVGITSFEDIKVIKTATQVQTKKDWRHNKTQWDTIIVPAKEEGFQKVFLGEDCWYAVRIGGGMLDKLKYIAAYQVSPIMAVTHIAEIDQIEPYGDNGKYKLIFKKKAEEIEPIPYGDAPSGSMQGLRYTNYKAFSEAKTIKDLLS
jgi:hypothetical protein